MYRHDSGAANAGRARKPYQTGLLNPEPYRKRRRVSPNG